MLEFPTRSTSYIGKDFSGTRKNVKLSTGKSEEEKLLDSWDQRDVREISLGEVQKLLHAAIGSNGARAPGVTDRLLQLFMKLYRNQTEKSNLLRLICTDFGFESKAFTT
jgi:hypothetical protein